MGVSNGERGLKVNKFSEKHERRLKMGACNEIIGTGGGYVVGKFSGYLYSEYFTSVFSSESIVQLWLAPYRFAIYGAVIGAFAGALAIMVLSMRRNICCQSN